MKRISNSHGDMSVSVVARVYTCEGEIKIGYMWRILDRLVN